MRIISSCHTTYYYIHARLAVEQWSLTTTPVSVFFFKLHAARKWRDGLPISRSTIYFVSMTTSRTSIITMIAAVVVKFLRRLRGGGVEEWASSWDTFSRARAKRRETITIACVHNAQQWMGMIYIIYTTNPPPPSSSSSLSWLLIARAASSLSLAHISRSRGAEGLDTFSRFR